MGEEAEKVLQRRRQQQQWKEKRRKRTRRRKCILGPVIAMLIVVGSFSGGESIFFACMPRNIFFTPEGKLMNF